MSDATTALAAAQVATAASQTASDAADFAVEKAVEVNADRVAAQAAKTDAQAAAAAAGAQMWVGGEAVTTATVRQAPDGSRIKSNAARTTRATFDPTEQGFWTPVLSTAGTLEQVALLTTIGTKVSTDVADSGSSIGAALAKRYRVQTMNLRDVVTPSGVNDTAAVNAALATFAAAGGGKLVIPRDDWKFTGSTSLELLGASSPVHIEAEHGAVFDLTGSTAAYGLRLGGSATATTAALGADVTKGADTLTCASVAAAVVVGDIIQIESTDLFETTQNLVKGELAEVRTVSGSTITLRSGLLDSYTAATTTVTKMQMPRVSVEELTLLRNSNHIGLQISYARDVLLGGLYAEGARATLFGLERVFGGTVDNVKGRDFWYSGGTSCYGLQVNGQHIKEIGLDLRGGRHAVSHGGTLPTRDIQTIGGTFDSYHPAGLPCFDHHGNCEDLTIMGAALLNGLGSGGSNLYVGGGTHIKGQNRPAVELNPSRSCDYMKIENTDIETTAAWAGVQYIARNGANATTLGLLKIDATIRSVGPALRIAPNAATDTGATIDRLVVRGDMRSSGSYETVQIAKATAAYVGINEAEFDGRFRAPGANGMSLAGTSTGTAKFRGKFQTDGNGFRPIDCTMFGDVTLADATLKGTVTPFRSRFTNTGGLYMSNVTIDGAFAAAFEAGAGPTEVMQSNVRRINGAGAPTLPARHFSRINSAQKVTTQGTAAPTAGTWAVGDRCENTAPAVGSAKAWVCTVAGTPGTWVSEGNL